MAKKRNDLIVPIGWIISIIILYGLFFGIPEFGKDVCIPLIQKTVTVTKIVDQFDVFGLGLLKIGGTQVSQTQCGWNFPIVGIILMIVFGIAFNSTSKKEEDKTARITYALGILSGFLMFLLGMLSDTIIMSFGVNGMLIITAILFVIVILAFVLMIVRSFL